LQSSFQNKIKPIEYVVFKVVFARKFIIVVLQNGNKNFVFRSKMMPKRAVEG
jgi:hypothetical protein